MMLQFHLDKTLKLMNTLHIKTVQELFQTEYELTLMIVVMCVKST